MATVEIPVDVSYEAAAAQDGPKFVGMGKEELLRKANEPFWVYLRWALFILFWGAWLGMLAGAVVIILNAPKSETDCTGTSTESSSTDSMDIAGQLVDLYGDLTGQKVFV